MPEVIWDNPHAYNPSSELLIDLATLLFFNQQVSTPTRKSNVCSWFDFLFRWAHKKCWCLGMFLFWPWPNQNRNYSRTHNNLICNIISNFTHSLEKINISFIYNALHHPNEQVRLLLHVKLASANSVFAENCRYLSFKYQITREDWNKPHSFLLGKVKMDWLTIILYVYWMHYVYNSCVCIYVNTFEYFALIYTMNLFVCVNK